MAPVSFMDIYAEYVRLRQSGTPMDLAIRTLQALVDQLDQNDRHQLNLLVRQWEARDSNSYLLNQATNAPPPPKRSSVIRPINTTGAPAATPPPSAPPPPQASPARAGFGEEAPAGRIFCSQCGKQNRASDKYCYSCGSLLQLTRPSGATKGLVDQSMNPEERLGTAYFGSSSTILLVIRGASITVDVREGAETVIGRSSPDSPMKPDVDLAAFDAENLGVSRLHASLRRDDFTLQVTDLSSKNHTFINGQRLYPREVRVLRDGDEIRLGRLQMKAVFRR